MSGLVNEVARVVGWGSSALRSYFTTLSMSGRVPRERGRDPAPRLRMDSRSGSGMTERWWEG